MLLLFLVISCLFLTSAVQSQNITTRRFFKEADLNLGAWRLSSPSTEPSLLSCGVACVNRYPSDCHSFIYNSLTGQCTPAGWPDVGQPGPTAQEGHLYTTASCDTADGFAIYSNNTAVACLHFPNVNLAYADATNTCQTLSAHLLTVRTHDEVSLHPRLTTDQIYLGLDDQVTEDRFVWVDDDSEISDTWKGELFPSAPNNGGGVEDCVALIVSFGAYDVPCTDARQFICERFVNF